MPSKTKSGAFERFAIAAAKASGSDASIKIHAVLIIAAFCLCFFGYQFLDVGIGVTTWLTIEGFFIQMFTVKISTEIAVQSPDIDI